MTLSSQAGARSAGLVTTADSEGFRKANVVTDVKLPRDLKAKVMIWSDLTIENILELNAKWSNVHEVKEYLAGCFNLETYKDNKQETVLIDLYYYTLQFCRKSRFSSEQTSALFSIIKSIHEAAVETPFNNLPQCYKYMKDLILCHSVKRPPFGIELFSPDDAKVVSEYIVNSYFRHFKLYKFVFTPKLQLDVSFNYKGLYEAESDGAAEELESKPGTAATGLTVEVTEADEEEEEDETPAMKELKAIIQEELDKHLQHMKTSLEENIKSNDEAMNQKLQSIEETQSAAAPAKRPPSKGKKK